LPDVLLGCFYALDCFDTEKSDRIFGIYLLKNGQMQGFHYRQQNNTLVGPADLERGALKWKSFYIEEDWTSPRLSKRYNDYGLVNSQKLKVYEF
jgi:hypothetical protein